ncbi:MAG: M20/M25/M40 family metallo-hydrolase [Chloracidobacterium sp.]|nr:M20/M25/M40 family metallo-hydrolase [Chloracidobacterium sp.]
MKKNILAFLLLATFLFQSAFAQTAIKVTPEEKKIAEGVTAKQLSDYLYFVASDEMEGRDTPSRGLDIVAKFMGMNLSKWGFKPAGDNGTFYQKIALKSESVDPAKNTIQIGGQNFALLEDFYRLSGNTSVNAALVFVRDGWMVKAKGVDAYKGVDVKDKIIVVYGQGFPRGPRATTLPSGVTEDDLKGTKGTDWADPLTYAKSSGAKGMILVASPQTQEVWPQLKNFIGRSTSYPEKLRDVPAEQNDFPVVLVSSKVGDAIFAGESANKDSAAAFALNKSGSMTVASNVEIKWTQNVVAVWEGSDPVLKNEMVAIGAHYDHVGTNPNASGPDKIWNGADDDGSGTVAVLSIAEALAKTPKRPKRSVLFVWHAGEEKGLWGAEYFNKFPTVDIKNVIAQLNIDMIGRSRKAGDTNPKNKALTDENSTYVIGSEMMSSTLGSVIKGANSGYLNMGYDYKYDDPNDTEKFFFRSDHFHYAVKGIPVAFWFSGVHEDYHQPGDHADKIDYNKMEKITRTIFVTLLKLADLKERPKVDKQLPPELTQR